MSDFLHHLKELINKLACVGVRIIDAEVVEHVLMALRESYEGLVNTLMYRPALPTVVELTGILMQDDLRREIKGKRNNGEALLVKEGVKKVFANRKDNSCQKIKEESAIQWEQGPLDAIMSEARCRTQAEEGRTQGTKSTNVHQLHRQFWER